MVNNYTVNDFYSYNVPISIVCIYVPIYSKKLCKIEFQDSEHRLGLRYYLFKLSNYEMTYFGNII